MMRSVTVKRIMPTKGGDHTRLLVEKNGAVISAMYFGVSPSELSLEVGDSVDLLFNIDINDYKNVLSAQMLVRDIRLSREYTEKLEGEKRRYEEVSAGGGFSFAEDFVPGRDDCARVYNFLRYEFRGGNSLTDTVAALREINKGEQKEINYVKLKYIFRIFNELKICDISEIDKDIYSFQVIFSASKTSIDKSAIFKKLRSQCTDRNQQ